MGELRAVDSKDDLPSFLHYLYDGLEGYVATATKEPQLDPNGEVVFTRQSFVWPEQESVLIDWIKENTPHRDVYVAPAIFASPSGKREDFKASNVAWIDCDGNVPTEAVLEQNSIPGPGLTVQSSSDNNQHWYWKFESPVTDLDSLQGINRALAYQLGADRGGWDAGQVLRPPATVNHKNGLPVFIRRTDTSVVAPIAFDVLPAVEATQVTIPQEAIPDVTDVVLKYPFSPEVIKLYKEKPEPFTRSDKLMALGYYLAEMGMSDVEMFSVLRNADDRWGKFKNREDRVQRLSDLIAVAREKYPDELVLDIDQILVYGALSFLNTEVEIEWVIPGLLQAQGYMLLTGPSGVGKTQFSLRWAICLALGRSFLGMEVIAPQRVIFFSLEMGHADLKFFLSTMLHDATHEDLLLLEQNFLLVPLGEPMYLDQPKQQAQMDALMTTYKPTGVFIDSVGSSSSGNVSDESTVKALMDFNDRLRQRYSVFTWFIHHMRKAQGDNKKPNTMADVYGNQYLVNRATSVYCLWKGKQQSEIEVIPLKKRLAPMEDPWFITRLSNLDFITKDKVNVTGLVPTKGMGLEPTGPTYSMGDGI